MAGILIVVDGPNLFNDVGKYFARDGLDVSPKESLQSYMTEWFDVDRLVRATLPDDVDIDPWHDLGIVVFRSSRALGRTPYRLDQEATDRFWSRQGGNPNTSTMFVQVPGEKGGGQPKDGEDEDDGRRPEKGVDTSIVVHLFETIDSWDHAVLFTRDRDLVPAVWALKRRGKRVYCVGRADGKTTPLVEASQHDLSLNIDFLRLDRSLYQLLMKDGLLDEALRDKRVAPKAKHLMISIRDTEFAFVSSRQTVDGNLTNAINDVIRPSGIHVEGIGAQKLDFRGGTREKPFSKWELVREGLRRHVDCFGDAHWSDRPKV